ncbi:hypothetical protein LNKW23_40960 [Paralimibaculum aggregatum]|uniref:CTP synthetase n=1 Tax=Paralimibaculum aggregatum TaxID=3036245 RepID=A0ABQ6LSB7_9RHOB|nr:CTP synthetase [Limibaculum sp. NKW23]GMG84880.1 hypothetical protein LNKW23_40960 [Limibaculum sp. NKW23]
MYRLAAIIYALVGPTLAGVLMIAALVSGFDTLQPILVAAAVGFLGGLPLAWAIAARLSRDPRG